MNTKKIGIWGFGIVGKTALHYFAQRGYTTSIMDAKPVSSENAHLLEKYHSTFVLQKDYESFLHNHDYILASPGIDLHPFAIYRHKFITELDLFFQEFKKPIIAITGTVGKTSVTHLLSSILAPHKKMLTGGNIGTGMLSLLDQKDAADGALLEVSSFQLEYCNAFAPDLAIWTNFYPNHLDRHETIESYFNAKYMILARQQPHQHALVPIALAPQLKRAFANPRNNIHFFSEQKPRELYHQEFPNAHYFWIEDNHVIQATPSTQHALVNITELPSLTFAQNWLTISASLSLLGIPQTALKTAATITLPSHRVEKIASIKGVDFFNDSKGTVIEATLAAVKKLQGKPILLFMGGISKGVDRSHAFKELKNLVKTVYCFGAEANSLGQGAAAAHIPCHAFSSLDEAFHTAVAHAQPGEQILFSPSGASFDLFSHYEERGNYFKKLVEKLQETSLL